MIYATSKDIASLLEILKSESEEAINWFETNHMFANPDKFQAIVVHHNKNINKKYTLKVNNIEIEFKNSVKLLSINIDNKLLCDKRIASLCKKAANQLHTICRLQSQMGKKEKEILINSFFTQTLIIVHLSDRLILDYYESNNDALLLKSGNIEVIRLRTLGTDSFKTLKYFIDVRM